MKYLFYPLILSFGSLIVSCSNDLDEKSEEKVENIVVKDTCGLNIKGLWVIEDIAYDFDEPKITDSTFIINGYSMHEGGMMLEIQLINCKPYIIGDGYSNDINPLEIMNFQDSLIIGNTISYNLKNYENSLSHYLSLVQLRTDLTGSYILDGDTIIIDEYNFEFQGWSEYNSFVFEMFYDQLTNILRFKDTYFMYERDDEWLYLYNSVIGEDDLFEQSDLAFSFKRSK